MTGNPNFKKKNRSSLNPVLFMKKNPGLSYKQEVVTLNQPFSCRIRHIPLKRIFDILFSVSALVASFPFFVLIATAVRLTSRGRSVYSQERIGRGGKTFKCYKFRTMYPDAESRLKSLLENNPAMQSEWDLYHKLKNDPRVTPFGWFLRKSSLDELPQFWNVLKGDLSVVGPRPVVRAELEKHLTEKAEKILSIRPGITGPWQVSGRSNTCYQKRIELDEHYVENQSFWWDLKLILKTVPAMLTSKGAY